MVLVGLCLVIGLPLAMGVSLGRDFTAPMACNPDLVDSEWERTDQKHPLPKQLMFVHFEKSAGSYFWSRNKAAVGESNYMDFHSSVSTLCNVPKDYFLIANIRNPCEQAVSDWEYHCEKTYAALKTGQPNTAGGGENMLEKDQCPSFSLKFNNHTEKWEAFPNPEAPNYEGFRAAVADGTVGSGSYQKQIKTNLAQIGYQRINCWVRYENLMPDMDRCLREYELATGNSIDRSKFGGRHENTQSHHFPCQNYYTDRERNHVRESNKEIMEHFNYTTCC